MSDWLPEGAHARDFRKLQMKSDAVARASVNEARQARGLQPVNSCWLWGGSPARRLAAWP
jgi:hypothetical protein